MPRHSLELDTNNDAALSRSPENSKDPKISVSHGNSPTETYFLQGDGNWSRQIQEMSEPGALRSRRNSRVKSDNELAIELARELMLVDENDSVTQHPLLIAQLESLTTGKLADASPEDAASGGSLHPNHSVQPRARSPARHRSPNPTNRQRSNSSANQHRICEMCSELGKERYLCILCSTTYCPACWNLIPAHRQGKLGPDNIPHEKTNHDVAARIHDILGVKIPEDKQKELHLEDENTTWFGVAKDDMNEPVFQDSGRYSSLMAECSSLGKSNRYPSLVAFVGQTGAGKSTLIKMLIELRPNGRKGPVPVIGSPDLSIPTSGDVHLYSDPETHSSDHPMLYADCEGLEGGEHEPFAAIAKNFGRSTHEHISGNKRTGSFTKKLRKKHHSSQREILWASNERNRTREFFVTNLYPRLLYTFCDVVVFVLKNPRTIETVVERLIEWAAAAIGRSTNQPVLPHVIIALNGSENKIDPAQWHVNCATRKLMTSIGEALSKPSLKEYARSRSNSTREIRTAEDLLLSYYCSVRVVRIPTQGRPQLINDQVDKLYKEISQNCQASRQAKRKVRMLLNADELQPYLQLAFDHFSSTLDTPFDFVKAYLLHNPIPADFAGNITKLAIKMMQRWENRLDAVGIFKELSPMIASCIMLDAARHKIKGKAESIFREHYIHHCDDALEDFCDRHYPCEFTSKAGRCVNVKSGHSAKGHQLKNGRTFGASPSAAYESSFSAETFGDKWKSLVHHDLELLLGRLREASNDTESEEKTAWQIHQRYILTSLFKHIGSSENYVSHSTCFACLMAPPVHTLLCGHVFCTPCVQTFGRMRRKCRVEITQCPLWHSNQRPWDPCWPIELKPQHAGVRILTLDGGGIRGVAELEILRLLHKALGGKIPLHSFFDLIVGTSAGGIIALGLGVKAWSVESCIERFKSLCGPSFSPRKFQTIPILRAIVEAHFHSKYESRPLQAALEHAFSDNYLFGGQRIEDNDPTKVAVVATSAAGLRSVVLSNYNRENGEEKTNYRFQRPDDPKPEMKTWEAARATSAAPTYYKAFNHEPSKEVYLDGGINHNNPVSIADSERKLLWPDVAKIPPDAFFSIGSGYCPQLQFKRRPTKDFQRLGAISNVKALYRIAVDHIESSLDSERAWQDYISILSLPDEQRYRFQRFNTEINDDEPPKLDDIDSMDELASMARQQWSRNKQIQEAADLLIASCFYFEKVKLEQRADDFFECTGYIQCRFPPGMHHIQGLGGILRERHMKILSEREGKVPPALYFVIEERYREKLAQQIPISQSVLETMISNGRFSMGQVKFSFSNKFSTIDISLSLAKEKWSRISGFPRQLQQEEKSSVVRKPGSSSSRHRTLSQRERRGQWAGPQPLGTLVRDNDTISSYSSPDWIIGNSTRSSMEETYRRFSQSVVGFSEPVELPGHDMTIHELE